MHAVNPMIAFLMLIRSGTVLRLIVRRAAIFGVPKINHVQIYIFTRRREGITPGPAKRPGQDESEIIEVSNQYAIFS